MEILYGTYNPGNHWIAVVRKFPFTSENPWNSPHA
jgi:hypothetical protein